MAEECMEEQPLEHSFALNSPVPAPKTLKRQASPKEVLVRHKPPAEGRRTSISSQSPLDTANAVMTAKEREASASLFNSDRRSVWFLPRKPTRLYMYDVIARAQLLGQENSKPRFIFVPSGHWRVLYGYFLLTIATVDLSWCCFSITFCHGARATRVTTVLYSVIYTIDMVVKFCSALPMFGGLLEFRPTAIAKHYMRGSFFFDLITILPFEYAWETTCWPENGRNCGINFIFSWQWLRIGRWASAWRACDNWRSVTSTQNDGVLSTVKYTYLLFLVAHVVACVMYWTAMGDAEPVCDHRNLIALPWANVSSVVAQHNSLDPFNQLLVNPDTGVLPTPETDAEAERLAGKAMTELYIYWLWAGMALLLGDPIASKNSLGRAVGIFFLIGGNVVFALVFGEVIMAMEAASVSQDQYARKMQMINEMMVQKGVPENFQRRVHRFYEFMWMVHGSAMNEHDMMCPMEWLYELPAGLRVDINMQRYKSFLIACPLFERMPQDLLVMVAQHLMPLLVMPDEIIVKEGTVGDAMYFVSRGQVRVIVGRGGASETALGTIGRGGFFGEMALVTRGGARRTATLIASTLLMLESLSAKSMQEVAEDFPQLVTFLSDVAKERKVQLADDNMNKKGRVAFSFVESSKVMHVLSKLRSRARAASRTEISTLSARRGGCCLGQETSQDVHAPRRTFRSRGLLAVLAARGNSRFRGDRVQPAGKQQEDTYDFRDLDFAAKSRTRAFQDSRATGTNINGSTSEISDIKASLEKLRTQMVTLEQSLAHKFDIVLDRFQAISSGG